MSTSVRVFVVRRLARSSYQFRRLFDSFEIVPAFLGVIGFDGSTKCTGLANLNIKFCKKKRSYCSNGLIITQIPEQKSTTIVNIVPYSNRPISSWACLTVRLTILPKKWTSVFSFNNRYASSPGAPKRIL